MSPKKGLQKNHTVESKQKISKNNKGNTKWLGKTHSDETKKKMSKSAKGHNRQIGENNNQYGTHWYWITNNKEFKKIKKEELNYWINLGYKRGRKISDSESVR